MMHGESAKLKAILMGLCLLAASVWADSAKNMGPIGTRRFEVSDYRDGDGKRWIHLYCEFECSYREKMEDLIATLWDFPNSPKVFSNIDSVRVLSETDTTAVTEQRTGVRILGLSFVSRLVYKDSLVRKDSGAATMGFETIETDDSVLFSKGGWDLEDRSDSSGPATYAVYHIENYIDPRFPAESAILRDFGAPGFRKVMRELGVATAKARRENTCDTQQ
jgi:hypothetical protein